MKHIYAVSKQTRTHPSIVSDIKDYFKGTGFRGIDEKRILGEIINVYGTNVQDVHCRMDEGHERLTLSVELFGNEEYYPNLIGEVTKRIRDLGYTIRLMLNGQGETQK